MRELAAYLLFWPVLMVLAIGNGIIRQVTYGQILSDLHAHQLSTAIAVLIFGAAVCCLAKVCLPRSAVQAIMLGLMWLLMTLSFEFLFGRYVAGHSWEALFHDYNVLAGRVWLVLLVWVTCLPYIAFKYLGQRA